ncbi:MAG: hypothetical protein F4X20_06260 [Dehalococcoidia bacterium]|nr:hypothetical protein [Dehalococcoidia bacterium]
MTVADGVTVGDSIVGEDDEDGDTATVAVGSCSPHAPAITINSVRTNTIAAHRPRTLGITDPFLSHSLGRTVEARSESS